jgi:hypothetical protein
MKKQTGATESENTDADRQTASAEGDRRDGSQEIEKCQIKRMRRMHSMHSQ